MKRLEQLYEGKSKIIYATEDPDLVIQYFKDDASAFNGIKKGTIVDKLKELDITPGSIIELEEVEAAA